MRKLATKWFQKWAKKNKIPSQGIFEIIEDLQSGHSATSIGKYLYKVRVSGNNRGKSAGFRTIVVFKENERVVFLFGFGKNQRANISKGDLDGYRELAKTYIKLDEQDIDLLLAREALFDLETENG